MIRPITKLEAASIKSKMGVSTGILLSLIWIIQVSSEQVEIGIGDHQPAKIEKIDVDITHNTKNTDSIDRENTNESSGSILLENEEFLVLVDTWWKILAWSITVLALSCLCCYFSRCCYLCYDCCSDPFWGCCPQSRCCNRFLLMKNCFESGKPRLKRRGTYTICKNPSEIDEEIGAKSDDQDDGDEEGELSDLEDFTLRTVESLEVDAMLDKFSPIKGKNKSENSGKIVASTPMKKQKSPKKNNKKNKTENEKNKSEVDAVFLELSGEAESMPQLFPTHYFNILNLFGIGCKNYNVSTVAEQHGKYMQTPDTITTTKNVPMQILNTNSSGKSYTANEDSTIGLVSDDDEILSFDRSVINNQDFLLSSSFNNMYKKNGLHIEEGQVGRYHPLPEAKYELLPPADFLRKVKRQNSMSMNRRSRSMENFRSNTNPSSSARQNSNKKYASGSLHQKIPSRLHDGDESSPLPSPPPVPSSKSEKRVTCNATNNTGTNGSRNSHNHNQYNNGNFSSTTTDEEIEVLSSKKRTHSEGSRIGHRRTPSMEGVVQIQNGVRASGGHYYHRVNNNGKIPSANTSLPSHPHSRHQSSDLPPKAPNSNSTHKKRYSHRRMKLMDIDDDIERCILYGKETTL